MEVQENITADEILIAAQPTIYYGANTCWWTHDPAHLGTRGGLPTDPRGGVLFEIDDVAGFIEAAKKNQQHYGRHGFRAFMAAHHQNCIQSLELPIAWCAQGWMEYNDALDRLDERTKVPVQ